jgi:polysaccharide pyruvyl transferase WcaK-like protein
MALTPIRVGLLWHSATSGNLGVAALTVANISIAKEVAAKNGLDPQFLIIGMRDGERGYIDDPAVRSFIVDGRSLISPSGTWSELNKVDCVLDIGGGDSFAQIYGGKRFAYLWLTKMMTLARHKPLLLSPQTIGPFTSKHYRLLAKAALERAHAVLARDSKSFEFLRDLAPKANAILATDVAFALPFEDRSATRSDGRLRVGLNVSGLLFTDAEAGRNRFSLDIDYAALTRGLLRNLAEREDVEVHLFAHVAAGDNPTDDDARVCRRLAEEFPKVVLAPPFAGPSDAKSYMSGLDFVIAGRMHACIGAFSAGVAVVPISYSRKFEGLFGTLGYPWLVPTNGMNTEEARDFILDCLEKREALRDDAAKGMRLVSGYLDAYRAELASFYRAALAR